MGLQPHPTWHQCQKLASPHQSQHWSLIQWHCYHCCGLCQGRRAQHAPFLQQDQPCGNPEVSMMNSTIPMPMKWTPTTSISVPVASAGTQEDCSLNPCLIHGNKCNCTVSSMNSAALFRCLVCWHCQDVPLNAFLNFQMCTQILAPPSIHVHIIEN